MLGMMAFPQISAADDFTAADVLGWSAESQASYFQTSVTMIGIVATQTGEHGHIAECIDGWYGGAEAGAEQRAERIRTVMGSLLEFHPQAVILAVIEDACGDF